MTLWGRIEQVASTHMFLLTLLAAAVSLLAGLVAKKRDGMLFNVRVVSVFFSAFTLLIGYFGFYHSHMVENPGVGAFLRWSMAALFLAPQIILAMVVVYANTLLRVGAENYKGLAVLSGLYLWFNCWSYFILTSLN